MKGSKLFFCKTPSTTPHGMLDLVDCLSAKVADTKSKKKNGLEIIINNESYMLAAQIEKDRDDWISYIGRAIVKHSSIYVPILDEDVP